jgi:hypothetical protein
MTRDITISNVMLNHRHVDPMLLRIGELRWAISLCDPETDAVPIMIMDKTEFIEGYRVTRQNNQLDETPMRPTISSGGDHVPAPIKEMDMADRTIGRLVEIYEYLRKIKGGGDHASDKKVSRHGQVIDTSEDGRPVTIPGDHALESPP